MSALLFVLFSDTFWMTPATPPRALFFPLGDASQLLVHVQEMYFYIPCE